jgi:outer membrane receptor protein involved in Fe transport
MNANFGGGLTEKIGLTVNFFGKQSGRFLDPVDPGNFNNRGGTLGLHVRTDWQPTANDSVLLTFAAGGTDFHITNDHEQELAGQRQRQELRDNRQSFRWQRLWSSSTVTDLALYRQTNSSNLRGSSFDTPLFASQERSTSRLGIVGSLTHSLNDHVLKLGFDASRVSLNEFFTFAVTDEDEAEEVDISEEALEFDRDDPFLFRDRDAREQFSIYAQDSFSPLANLTVNAGVRYDYSNLPVAEQQLSPRLGIAYFIPKSKTALRGSFDRLYMPAQVENLLLASSEEARRLSPFATASGGGSAVVRAERVSAWELGFAQDVFGIMSIDAAYWSRTFRNYADPNVFFNTTIIFPNSVAEGFARGVDVRLDVPERKGWSGYVSYGNARIVQTGPINGGLFLTDEVIEIGPGTKFTPDQDVRNTASFGVTYQPRGKGFWLSLMGRHESGVPLEVDDDELDDLRERTGADLVNFERGRVKPWTIFDLGGGFELFKEKRVNVQTQISVENIANRRFVYNFGNPFSGTHFGHPRMLNARIKFVFR